MEPLNLQFVQGQAGSFTFDTGVLKGVLRHEGRSIGLTRSRTRQTARRSPAARAFLITTASLPSASATVTAHDAGRVQQNSMQTVVSRFSGRRHPNAHSNCEGLIAG